MFQLGEARPGLSGALFVSDGKSLGAKKRERRTDKGAQIKKKVIYKMHMTFFNNNFKHLSIIYRDAHRHHVSRSHHILVQFVDVHFVK